MRKQIIKRAAVFMALIMMSSIAAPQNVRASENEFDIAGQDNTSVQTGGTENTENDVPENTEDERSVSEEDSLNVEASETVVETEEENTPESDDVQMDQRLNYIYVESPYLETPGTQNIVVSWGDGTEDISKASIVCQKDDGEQEVWECSLEEDGLFLFSRSFSDEESGCYTIVSVHLFQNDKEFEFLLSDLEAEFGVNQEYEGYAPGAALAAEGGISAASLSENDLDVSVVSIDENGEVHNEESIESALANAVSEAPKKSRARAGAAANGRTSEVVVALDAGHDNLDAGASYNGLKEEVLTLKIANYAKAELEQYDNVAVYMTRTGAGCPVGVTAIPHAGTCIWERVRRAAAAGARYFVSIHLNASVASSAGGAEVIIPNKSWKPWQNAEGEALANKILAQLTSLGLSRRSVYFKNATDGDTYQDGSIGDYFAVQNAGKQYDIPGLIVEHAFISNIGGRDQTLLTSEAGLKSLGVADATAIASYLGLSKSSGGFTGWKNENNKYYYYRNGKPVTGQRLIGQQIYYFNDDGVMQTGWQTVDGKRCYFYPSGSMATGTVNIGGINYTFDMYGGLTGWQQENGIYHYYKNGKAQTGWQYLGNQYYYFNSKGEMQTGWQKIGEQLYYFYPSGGMITGWQTMDGKTYYFYPSGGAATGGVSINGTYYQFDDKGVLLSQRKDGWNQENGIYYYYKNGKAQTGWQYIGSQYYYFNSKGEMQTGWQKIGQQIYYFYPSGGMITGWQTMDGKTYYFYPSGGAATGGVSINGTYYQFDDKGVLLSQRKDGWNQENGIYYYYKNGKAQTGWQYIGSQYYYFNSKGEMQTGWQKIGQQIYYFYPSGGMITGWQTMDGKTYYFYPSGGAAIGLVTIGVQKYYFDSKGIMQTGLQTIDGKMYYFYPSGGMAQKKVISISGKEYYFDMDGTCIETSNLTPIMGSSTVTVDRMVNYYNQEASRRKITYPGAALGKGGASDIRTFCTMYYEEAQREGVRAEVAFAQAMVETGYLQFGGDVKINQFNFAGIGATGGVPGNSFKDVRTGITAQIQHLKCYATSEPLNGGREDPRWSEGLRNKAPYVEWLSIPHNPYGTGWAGAANYASLLLNIMKQL